MNAEHVKERLHHAIHRTPRDVSRKEFEEITAVVLAIVMELAAEMALVVGELSARVDALETAQGHGSGA
jgi:hypothetical protein